MLDTYSFRVDEVLKGDLNGGNVISVANRRDVDRIENLSPFSTGERLVMALELKYPAEEQQGSEHFPEGVFVPLGGTDVSVFDIGTHGVVTPRSELIRGATPGAAVTGTARIELSVAEVRSAAADR